ncbi:MAG: ribonuclease III, partial [Pseudomonadota bacterium]
MASLEHRLGYTFKNKSLLREALTHASSIDRANAPTYERLEFLGDRVLGLTIADMLFAHFPNSKEGDLAPRLTALVRGETCALVSEILKLGDELILGDSEIQTGGRGKQAILADACEAVIGAIFIDGGWEKARAFVATNWQAFLENPPQILRDAKTLLQEWAQSKGYDLPA